MYYTQHYQLPQWEKSDRILMDDFNDMTKRIDTGLEQAERPCFQIGVLADYDGSADVSVDLGRQPAMVMVGNRLGWSNIITSNSSTSDPGHTVAMPGYPGYFSDTSGDAGSKKALEVTETGFLLRGGMKKNLRPYYYLALFSSET